jgi:hypothetical protein
MNTNLLKTFARTARNLFRSGVEHRLRYWGFDAKGHCLEALETIEGGFIFRGEVFSDTAVPGRWRQLEAKVRDAQTFKDTVEEAAYTWFNRLMATKILEENGYDAPVLRYAEGTHSPSILQNARRGLVKLHRQQEQQQLLEYLAADQDEQALALLLADYCNHHPLLHGVFGKLEDFTQLLLPDNLLTRDGILQHLNTSDAISPDDYREVELIGWLYQFYIADRKDEVFAGFKKGKKARPEDIPAATQIFTPRWIVRYMVENTIGRLWLDHHPHSNLREHMPYLVEAVQSPQSKIGNRQSEIVNPPQDLRLLDPACGSGHILVVGFDLLMHIYHEEGYGKRQAVEQILAHNLHGIDLDERAAQLARFALLLKAAKYYPEILKLPAGPGSHLQGGWGGGVFAIPPAYTFTDEQLHTFLGSDGKPYYLELRTAVDELSQLGGNVGSALVVNLHPDARQYLQQRLHLLLERQAAGQLSFFEQEALPRLAPYVEVLLALSDKYPAVVANPPYMGSGNMNGELKNYVQQKYPLSKSDLFAVFMEVCLNLLPKGGKMGMINQQSWMFLSSYEKLREHLLSHFTIKNMLHLGPRTFEELSGEVVQSTSFVLENDWKENATGTYFRLVDFKGSGEKERVFEKRKHGYFDVPQENFSKIPGSPIAFFASERLINIFKNSKSVSSIAKPKTGLNTGDNDKYLKYWFEIKFGNIKFDCSDCEDAKSSGFKWFPYNKGGTFKKWYGNNDYVVDYQNNGERIKDFAVIRNKGKHWSRFIQNTDKFYKEGLTWSFINSDKFGVRYKPKGFVFDVQGTSAFPDLKKIKFVAGLLCSKVSLHFLETLNPTLSFQAGNIASIPLKEIKDCSPIEKFVGEAINLTKTDWDAHETSWDFREHPLVAVRQPGLPAAWAAWEEQVTRDFYQLHANEEELNRLFIDIYSLEDELTPEVPLKDVTILQEELDRKALDRLRPSEKPPLPIDKKTVMEQLLSYAVGCLLGRYRLGHPGLHIAHPQPSEEELAPYPVPVPLYQPTANSKQPTASFEIDADGILPLMGRHSPFADDIVRQVRHWLTLVWGEATLTDNLNFLEACLGMPLEDYLCQPRHFWKSHVQRYKKKPIYWLFASSPKGDPAFKALAYMHRMDKYTVQRIRNNYLHPHQAWLREAIGKMKAGEGSLHKDDLKLLQRFENDLLECQQYDEQLKVLANRQIEFDLDDGVTKNWELFEGVVYGI